jgi:uncharacterized protein (DUF2062 family)
MWRRWSFPRQFKLNLIRLLRLRATPEQVARGFSLGLFIGMTPTFGVQMALALLAAILLRENKIAAVLGVWVTNPLTAPFIYAMQYETGRLLLGWEHPKVPVQFNYEFLKTLGWQVMLPLSIGSFIFAVLAALLGYLFVIRLVPFLRLWHIPRWPKRRSTEKDERF